MASTTPAKKSSGSTKRAVEHFMDLDNEEALRRTIARQIEQIRTLEELVRERSRDVFEANDELRYRVEELKQTQLQLLTASRRAGMADVATTVLHNVGNALNSVNVSANVIAESVRVSKAGGIGKAVALLRAQSDPGKFLTEDPRGKKLLDYLDGLAEKLESERQQQADEVMALEKNIEHIKAIVMTQQSLARGGDVSEKVSIGQKIADVSHMTLGTLTKNQVEARYDLDELATDEMIVDRHKLLQILFNLVTNAAQALRPKSSDRLLVIRVRTIDGDRVVFEVSDNGVGISAENLTKIFAHGFTTKADGHGFGLHSCANAAVEMGGRLEASSAGPGRGATFKLTLPRVAATSASRQAAASA